jgi:uncharacterized protein (DUF302 family)
MKILFNMILFTTVITSTVHAAEGMIKKKSPYSVAETANRFEQLVNQKKLTLFARIDHAANARDANLRLNPSEVLIFGNPKVGTPLMHCSQSVAIDLPQKLLVWQAGDGQVWVGYNEPNYLKDRHAIKGCEQQLDKITSVLTNLTEKAISQ